MFYLISAYAQNFVPVFSCGKYERVYLARVLNEDELYDVYKQINLSKICSEKFVTKLVNTSKQ